MDDPGVLGPLSGTEVLGVTAERIGTPTRDVGIQVQDQLCSGHGQRETHPTTFAELLQLTGLLGTDVWLGNAQDLIKAGIAALSTVIRIVGRHHGFTSCTQDSIHKMAFYHHGAQCGKG